MLWGFGKLFGPGTPTDEVVAWIDATMKERWKNEGVEA